MTVLNELREKKANRENYLCSFDDESWVCRFEDPPTDAKEIFVSIPSAFQNSLFAIRTTLEGMDISHYIMERNPANAQQLICRACRYITHSNAVIVEASTHNTNIGIEMGIAHARGKPVFVLTQDESDPASMVKGLHWIQYHEERLEELQTELEGALRVIFPRDEEVG